MRNHPRIAFAALAIASVALSPALAGQTIEAASAVQPEAETDADDAVPEAVTRIFDQVTASRDNEGLPFIIIDKVAATLFVFDAQGEFLGDTPALLGVTSGDESTPGIGDRELSDISPEERTTPAGRFLAQYGLASGSRTVLWVDYATSVALHPVATGNRKERRLQRLRSPSPSDNRITYGCINVPGAFYRTLILPTFREKGGIVYILPETEPMEEVFPTLRPRRAD